MTRQEFESLSSREQRKVAEREYKSMSALIFSECKENGIFSDIFGQFSDIHHIWCRSQCPLWYVFQRENLVPISSRLHFIIHFYAPSDWNPKVLEYYDRLQEVKERLKRENADYESRL
jgi:hypothetical protein